MHHYASKSYGRNQEVADIFEMFKANHDVSMPGPRRLGKTFVLERLIDAAPGKGWSVLKVDVSGCRDTRAVFREFCAKIGGKRFGGQAAVAWLRQRLGQAIDPRTDHAGPWYQPFLSLDHESYFERLIKALDTDRRHRWAVLIDELPIFLKTLHDRGPEGVAVARDFMNLTSRLRADYPRVRWLVTGSIGLEPLARAGNYMGVLAKFKSYELQPLDAAQARDLVQDLAATGHLRHRRLITAAEADALVATVGWRAAYYLEALAQQLQGQPNDDPAQAAQAVVEAASRLLAPAEMGTFGTWEEHLRKHYPQDERAIAFAVLAGLAPNPQGSSISSLLAIVGIPSLTKQRLLAVLARLHVEGFVTVNDWNADDPTAAFRNLLLRRWWHRYPPAD